MRPLTLLRLVALLALGSFAAQAQSTGTATSRSAGSAAASGSAKTAAASGSAATAAPAAGPIVSVTFKTFALPSAVQGVYYNSNGTIVPLSAQFLTLSQNNYAYTGPAKMEILHPDRRAAAATATAPADATAAPATSAAASGSDTAGAAGSGRRGGARGRGGRGGVPLGPMSVVSTVNFPKSGSYVLFLVPDSDGGASGIPLVNDAKDFPVGSVRFVNVTGYPLNMTIVGDKTFNLPIKALDSAVYHPKGTESFVTQFRRTDNDSTDVVFGSEIAPPSTGQRTNVFIYLGNRAQVVNDGEAPAFNSLNQPETPGANNAPGPGAGRGGSGRGGPGQGSGSGRRGRGAGG